MTSSSHLARRAAAGAALSCVAAVAACSSPTAPHTAKTVTAPAAPATSAHPTASVTTQAEAPAPSPAGPSPCPTRYLRAKLGLSQGAAGTVYQVIDFTNIGTVTCTLYGYPGVALAGGSPVTQIGLAASEDPATPRELVTLAPGAVANALLRIAQAANFPARKCGPTPATYLQIYPPNQTTPIYLAYQATACAKHLRILSVQVVKPGSGG
jgi:hypothetical protein